MPRPISAKRRKAIGLRAFFHTGREDDDAVYVYAEWLEKELNRARREISIWKKALKDVNRNG